MEQKTCATSVVVKTTFNINYFTQHTCIISAVADMMQVCTGQGDPVVWSLYVCPPLYKQSEAGYRSAER